MDLSWCKPFLVSLFLQLCTSQSVSTTLCSTCGTAPTCNKGCTVNADVVTTSSTSWKYYNPAIGTPFLQPYLHFTAYSVTSTSLVKGTCVRQTESPVPLVDPYIVSVHILLTSLPATALNYTAILGSSITAEYSVFLDGAYSSLYTVIGYERCTAALPPSPVVPPLATKVGEELLASSPALATALATALPSATTTETSVSVRHTHSTQIVILSVIVPVAGLIILLLCFIVIRRYRMKRRRAATMDQPDMTSDAQLYLDRKAELEDEDRRKYELDAGDITHEMEGEDRIFEMSGNRDMGMLSASLRETHEMRGAEHSTELEVPGNIS